MTTLAVIYVTYSPAGDDVPGEAQEYQCRAWAAAQGIEIQGVFSDVGFASGGDRPGFDEMLKALRDDPVDAVIALAPHYLASSERDRIRLGMLPVSVLYPPPARTVRDWYALPALLAAVAVGLVGHASAAASSGTPTSVAAVVGVLLGGLPVAGYAWTRTRRRLSLPVRDRIVTALLIWAVATTVLTISYLTTTPGLLPVPVAILAGGAPLVTLVCTLRALPPGVT